MAEEEKRTDVREAETQNPADTDERRPTGRGEGRRNGRRNENRKKIARFNPQRTEEDRALFSERFGEKAAALVTRFFPFYCPVAVADAMVEEHIVEDYDVLELLVLRLLAAGLHDIGMLARLSGMPESIIERALQNEEMVYRHVDENWNLTEMGRITLEQNSVPRAGQPAEEDPDGESAKSVNHVIYKTPRTLQIEAVTGTVIPGYMETRPDNMPDSREFGSGDRVIMPKESVEQDEELRREINERLEEYQKLDILKAGDTVLRVLELQSRDIRYRASYLVMMEGMRYPMIVMRGFKSVDKANRGSLGKGAFGQQEIRPLALSATDSAYLKGMGVSVEDIYVREDSVFQYLRTEAERLCAEEDAEAAEDEPEEPDGSESPDISDTPSGNEDEQSV